MNARHRMDDAFATWGRLVYRHRALVLAGSIALVVTFASFLPHMRTENSMASYLHTSDPASIAYEDFQRQFGQDDQVLLAIRPPDVFAPEFLEKLERFHRDLEDEVPHVTEVRSLVNARRTRGEGDTLVVGELFEEWREDGGDPEELRRRVFANPLYVDNLVSRDGRLTTVTLEPAIYSGDADASLGDALAGFEEPGGSAPAREPDLLSESEEIALVEATRAVIDRYAGPDFVVYAVGGPVLTVDMSHRMAQDARSYLSVAAVVIALFLFGLFRRFSGVVFPLLVVAAALVGNIGTMVMLDIPFSLVLAMLPVFTMCVGVCNAVHVLVVVYRRLAAGDEREDALAYALSHSGLAILMASLTTAAGMCSFITAEIAPIRDLGMTAPFGVLYAWFFSMTLLPALIAVFPPRRVERRWRGGPPWSEQLLVATGSLATRHPRRVLAAAALLLCVAGLGMTRLRFGHDPVSWFPDGDPTKIAFRLLDGELSGATTAEVRIDTGRENGLHDPETLRRIERAMHEAETLREGPIFVGKAISLVDVVKETHQALHADDPAYYAIPDSPELVAQELLLFENSGSDDLEPITDSRFQLGRLTLRVPMADAVLYRAFLAELERRLAATLGDGISFTLTGQTVIATRTFTALTESMARSYAFALLVITPLMIALIRDWRLGLISMVPNLMPVFVTLGAMGLLQIPLNTSTIMIGSMIVGLAVDDTIHFLHRFRRDYEATGDVAGAVRSTMATTGSALYFTSLVLATGFTVLGVLGTFANTIHFGLLSAFGIAVAFGADALVTPALISLTTRRAQRRAAVFPRMQPEE